MIKRVSLAICAAVWLLGLLSCGQDDEAATAEVSVSLSAVVPQESLLRSVSDYGTGGRVNRCILEVYRNGVRYGERQVQAVTAGQVSFPELLLVPMQTYDFVLWADCADGLDDGYYNTADLSSVSVRKPYTGNDDGFDAFCARFSCTVTESFTQSITLTRPFAQLCVTASDIDASTPDASKPTHAQVDFAAIPTAFNLLTGEPVDSQPISYTVAVENVDAGEMTVDYIWVAPEQDDMVQFAVTLFRDGTMLAPARNFEEVPLRRNYRTNVSAGFLP